MLKKVLALVLGLVMVLSTVSALAFSPVAVADLKVGFIFIGDITDGGYNTAHYNGLIKASENLGISQDQLYLKTNIPEDGKCETAIRELVEAGCQVIFGNSFGYQNYMEELADEFPEIIFIHCSGIKSNDTNYNNYYATLFEGRYLTGIAAGLKTKTNKLGFVGAMDNAEVNGGINAFYLGAKSVNPDVSLVVKYTNSWYDPTLERQTAEALIASGCDVIAQHCDTSNPQVAAQEAGVFGCGTGTDMTEAAPDAHLTAMIFNWENAIQPFLQQVIDGTYVPENKLYGLADGTVDISPLTKNVAEGTAEAIEAARAGIIDGTLDIFAGPLNDNEGNVLVKEGETLTRPQVAFENVKLLEGIIVE
ncbi:MAG: BMP family ABC transporter substrate-binding protein [Christensenellaceae bacterium]|nr:BMP family ABC transporter substrate-binding protein [Christensenellaceae bacterium]